VRKNLISPATVAAEQDIGRLPGYNQPVNTASDWTASMRCPICMPTLIPAA